MLFGRGWHCLVWLSCSLDRVLLFAVSFVRTAVAVITLYMYDVRTCILRIFSIYVFTIYFIWPPARHRSIRFSLSTSFNLSVSQLNGRLTFGQQFCIMLCFPDLLDFYFHRLIFRVCFIYFFCTRFAINFYLSF